MLRTLFCIFGFLFAVPYKLIYLFILFYFIFFIYVYFLYICLIFNVIWVNLLSVAVTVNNFPK